MECSNVGSIIVTIALQMHGTIVDVKLSDEQELIIESDSPISAEEVLVPAKKKRTRKKVLVRGGNKKTAKNK